MGKIEVVGFGLMIGQGRFGAGFGLVAYAAVSGGAASSALADNFYLKNGEVIEGSILKATINTLTLASGGAIELTSIGLIERVVVELADGSEITGELLSWKDGVFELRSAGDVVRVADGIVLDQDEAVEDTAFAAPPVEDRIAEISGKTIPMQGLPSFMLTNGDTLTGEILYATGSILTLKLSDGSAMPVSRAQVQAVNFASEDGTPLSGQLLDWQNGVYQLEVNDGEVAASLIGNAASEDLAPTALANAPSEVAADQDQLDTPVATEIEQADAALLPPVDDEATDADADVASTTEVGVGGPANETAVAALKKDETTKSDKATENPTPAKVVDGQHVIETLVDPVDENGQSVVFRFQLDKPADRPIVVLYAATEASAKAGEDFEAKSGVITFSKGSTSAEVQVPIIDDDRGEDSEQFNLFLSGDPKTVTFDQRQIAVTINDND